MSYANGGANVVDVRVIYKQPQVVSSTFRFSADRVSQSAATSALAVFAGVVFNFQVRRMGQYLCVTVDGAPKEGECQVDVRVTIVNANDSNMSISRSATGVTFDRQSSLVEWNRLMEPGFISSDDSIVVELSIGSVVFAKPSQNKAETVPAASLNSDEQEHNATSSNLIAMDNRNSSHSDINAGSGTHSEKRETGVSSVQDTTKKDAHDNNPETCMRSDNLKRRVALSKILTKYSISKDMDDEDSNCTDSVERETNSERSDTGGIDDDSSVDTDVDDCEPSAKKRKIEQKHFTDQEVQTENKDELFSSAIDVAKSLECQVCHSLLEPPINLCRTGHSLCGKCRDRVKNCPTCEAAFLKDTRDFTLESVMDYVLYPCVSASAGCHVKTTLDKREKHKFDCKKREFSCEEGGGDCEWKGPVDKFHEHVFDKHEFDELCEEQFEELRFPIESYIKVATKSQYYPLSFDRKVFMLLFSKYDDNFYACVKMIGTKNEARQYKCDLQVASVDPAIDYKFETSFQVHCDLEMLHEKCIPLSTYDVIEHNGLIDKNGDLAITVCLHKR